MDRSDVVTCTLRLVRDNATVALSVSHRVPRFEREYNVYRLVESLCLSLQEPITHILINRYL